MTQQNLTLSPEFLAIQANTAELYQLATGAKVYNVRTRADLALVTNDSLGGPMLPECLFRTFQYYPVGTVCPPVVQYWRWQAFAPMAWDISAVQACGGWFLQLYPDGLLRPEMFGAKSNYDLATLTAITDDIEAVRAGCTASAALGLDLIIRGKTYIAPTLRMHPIYLNSGTRIKTEGAGAIIHAGSANGVPWFWARNESGIAFDCKLGFAGALDPSNEGYNLDAEYRGFIQDIIIPGRQNPLATAMFGQDGPTAALLIMGGHDHLINMRGKALVNTGAPADVLRFKKTWLYVTNGDDGAKPYNLHSDELVFDGMVFGVLATAIGQWDIDKLVGYRYGEAGPYTALGIPSEPGHLMYLSSQASLNGNYTTSGTISINKWIDYGQRVNTGYNNGAVSIVARNADTFKIDSGLCLRPTGALDGWSKNWQVRNVYAEMDWSVIASGDNQVRPVRMTNGGPTTINGGVWENISYKISGGAAGSGGNVMLEIAQASNFRFEASIEIDALDPAYNMPLATLGAHNSEFDVALNVLTPNTSTGNGMGVALARIDGGGDGNRVRFKVRGLTSTVPPRFTENDKPGSVNNWAEWEKLDTCHRRTYSPGGQVVDRITSVISVPMVPGASITLANAIPAGARVEAISSMISTALGTSAGCIGYSIGVAGNIACYGARAAVGVGQGTGNALWLATAPPDRFSSATSLVLTATGGNFDATGQIDVSIEYVLAKIDANIYDAA